MLHLEKQSNRSKYIDSLILKDIELNTEQTIPNQKIDVSNWSKKQIKHFKDGAFKHAPKIKAYPKTQCGPQNKTHMLKELESEQE